jgi:hypothetical protein
VLCGRWEAEVIEIKKLCLGDDVQKIEGETEKKQQYRYTQSRISSVEG